MEYRRKKVKYIWITRAADILGVTTMTLRRWHDSKRLVPKKIHPVTRYRLYTMEQLDEFINKNSNVQR